jgi:hypothetical protein
VTPSAIRVGVEPEFGTFMMAFGASLVIGKGSTLAGNIMMGYCNGLLHFLSMAGKWKGIGTTAQRSIQTGRKEGRGQRPSFIRTGGIRPRTCSVFRKISRSL